MLQLEREKLGFQLKELENQYLILRKINPEIITKIIGLGSIIETSKANYFISISASEIEINTKKYFCISSKSPIGIILFGKKVNDIFEFNGINHQILQIT